jgi:HK97 family phage portal protein
MKIPILSWLLRARDKPGNFYTGSDFRFLFGGSTSGKTVNEFSAMQTTAVYACVRILAETIASLPLQVYRYTPAGKERYYEHPLYYLLHDEPNPEMSSFVFRETLMSHLLIWGNAYAQIIRNGAGRILALYPLLPDKMEVNRDDHGEIYYIYTKTTDENPNIKKYGQVLLRREDVLHIPGLGFDGLVGYSPIAMAKNAVGMTLACEEYGASFFANGANPGGVLEHPGVLKDPAKVRDSWNEVYRGANNAHKVAVLEEGMKYQQIGIPPEEAQFLETRKFQINEIARLFRIPPHMVGDLDKSSFSNIEQQSLEFVKYTVDPWVVRWEQALQRSLLSTADKAHYFIKLNVDGLLRGDYQSRMTGYSVGRQNGWFSANDIREMEDMNPIPDTEGGNLYLVNGSMTKLKDAGAFAATKQQGSGGIKK